MNQDMITKQSLEEFGSERLSALLRGIDADADAGEVSAIFKRLVEPWGSRPVGHRPAHRSTIADDEAPFEFSVGFSDGPPEVQFYVEPQAEVPALRSNMLAGRAVLESFSRRRELSLRRYRFVEDLFCPNEPQPSFTIWIGVSWVQGRGARYKVYLNPRVRGGTGYDLVETALTRLGFSQQWRALRERLVEGAGARRDEPGIVSLDLTDGTDARVKVYIRHHGATLEEVDAIARVARDHVPGDGTQLYEALTVGKGPFWGRPPQTELSFVNPDAALPAAVTWEFPIGSYVASDADACQRIEGCLQSFGLEPDAYSRAVQAFAPRPLTEGPGLHAHVTLRRIDGKPRIAVYLASGAYSKTATLLHRVPALVDTGLLETTREAS